MAYEMDGWHLIALLTFQWVIGKDISVLYLIYEKVESVESLCIV